jgi:hypothetical protein
MSDLNICSDCGWYDGYTHKSHGECSPERGAAADRLSARMPDVPSTKLGYGSHALTFAFDGHHSLTLHVNDKGLFSVHHLFWLSSLTEAQVESLVRGLEQAWRETTQGDR